MCFSIVGPQRSLDLVAQSPDEFDLFISFIRRLPFASVQDGRGSAEEVRTTTRIRQIHRGAPNELGQVNSLLHAVLHSFFFLFFRMLPVTISQLL